MSIETTLAFMNKFGSWNANPASHCRVYIIQALVADLGYRHQWFGVPLSKGLSEDFERYSERRTQYDETAKKLKFIKKVKDKISEVQAFMNPTAGIPQERWIEMLATTHYFRNICHQPGKLGKKWEDTYFPLNENRRGKLETFSEPEFKLAWQRLEGYDLLNKKHNRPEN